MSLTLLQPLKAYPFFRNESAVIGHSSSIFLTNACHILWIFSVPWISIDVTCILLLLNILNKKVCACGYVRACVRVCVPLRRCGCACMSVRMCVTVRARAVCVWVLPTVSSSVVLPDRQDLGWACGCVSCEFVRALVCVGVWAGRVGNALVSVVSGCASVC